jgi:hypothetical protein
VPIWTPVTVKTKHQHVTIMHGTPLLMANKVFQSGFKLERVLLAASVDGLLPSNACSNVLELRSWPMLGLFGLCKHMAGEWTHLFKESIIAVQCMACDLYPIQDWLACLQDHWTLRANGRAFALTCRT